MANAVAAISEPVGIDGIGSRRLSDQCEFPRESGFSGNARQRRCNRTMAGIAVFSHRCTAWSSTPSDRFPKASTRDSGIGYAGLQRRARPMEVQGSHVTQRWSGMSRIRWKIDCQGELNRLRTIDHDDAHFGSLRESSIKPLPPERSGCFAEHLVAGQSDVSENVVIKLAQLST